MLQFVSKQDKDYIDKFKSHCLGERMLLYDKNPIDPVDEISLGFEKIIRMWTGSTSNTIAKKMISHGVFKFREIDVLVEAGPNIFFGEVKSSLKANISMTKAINQVKSFCDFCGEIKGKTVFWSVIYVKIGGLQKQISAQSLYSNIIEVDANFVFEYGLKNGFFDNPDLLEMALEGRRYENKRKGGFASFGNSEPTTVGDFFNFNVVL